MIFLKAKTVGYFLFDKSLLPLDCAAILKPAIVFYQMEHTRRFYGCCATEREQAPSPQLIASVQPSAGFVITTTHERLLFDAFLTEADCYDPRQTLLLEAPK